MYVYIETERGKLWTVGFYAPANAWNTGDYSEFISESDHTSARDAAARCNYLNGGNGNLLG